MSKKAQVAYKTVPFWNRQRTLPVDPKDDQVRQTFSNGQCHSMALALNKLTGWPLFVLCDRYCECDETCEGSYCTDLNYLDPNTDGSHVVVRDPKGRFVDVDGAWWPHSPKNNSWEDMVPVPVTAAQARRLEWDRINVAAAMPFARAVLRTYKLNGMVTK